MNDWWARVESVLAGEHGQTLLLAGGVGLGLLLLAVLLVLLRRRPAPVAEPALTEALAELPPPPPLAEGEEPLRCHGLPVRIRLIVAAPLGTDAGGLAIEDVVPLLEAAMPGLGALAHRDQPKVRLWPTQLSTQGFTASFRRHAQLPDPEATVKPWIQLCGRVLRHRRPFALGLALLADRDHTLGPLVLEKPHQWMEVLRG